MVKKLITLQSVTPQSDTHAKFQYLLIKTNLDVFVQPVNASIATS